jgi:methionine-S-sulfoxide reductase
MDFVPVKKLPGRAEKVYLASGCFWFREQQYRLLEGVAGTRVGYMGGQMQKPTYMQVSSGRSGHTETVEVAYLPDMISFEYLLKFFFNHHNQDNNTIKGKEPGGHYRSAVFYTTDQQKQVIDKVMTELKGNGYQPVTEILPADQNPFYVAEDKHQGYYTRHELKQESNYFEDKFSGGKETA